MSATHPMGHFDHFARTHILPASLDRDVDLAHTMWFGYRTTHPMLLTARFYENFHEEFQYFQGKNLGIHETNKLSFWSFSNGALNQIYKARQAADSLCCPYKWFCFSVFKWHEVRNFSRLPSLYRFYDQEVLEDIKYKWDEEILSYGIDFEDIDLDDLKNNKQAWDAFILHLTKIIRNSTRPDFTMSGMIRDKLDICYFDEYFTSDEINEALRIKELGL